MAYILGLVVTILFFLVLHYFTELNKVQKMTVAAILFAVIAGAVAYNSYSYTQRDTMLNVVRQFEQNKTIQCDGVDVNQTNFTLSIGTYTFIGKEKTPYFNQMISASKCR
ncbi:hypothetical protein KJ877_02330 [bacterium]|nr:hypothetical protein [bacterium]MBU1990674.1 hypothetical protein [bacterium]